MMNAPIDRPDAPLASQHPNAKHLLRCPLCEKVLRASSRRPLLEHLANCSNR